MTTSWAQKYAPLASFVLVLFLALTVLPSALNVPQTNPATTLEYAPVPPEKDDNPPPVSGNLSSLGLAGSSSLTGEAEPETALTIPPVVPGKGRRPSTKRCVGNPPRQTEDPLSPPCVAFFDGDNGGATYQGVTRDEVRILVYTDGNTTSIGGGKGEEVEPYNVYYDLAKPAEDDDPLYVRFLRDVQRSLNERYQTYNRFVHLFIYYSYWEGAATPPETRRADAADNFATIKPFATVTAAVPGGNDDAYLRSMAERGVLNFGSFAGRDAAFFAQFPKLVWGYLPSIEKTADKFSSYVCSKAKPYPVSFSGDDASMGKPRKYGFLRTTDPAQTGMQKFQAAVKKRLLDCGMTFAAEATFPAANYVIDSRTTPEYAAQNMAEFQGKGVTTVIWPQGFEPQMSRAAAQIGYHPEWIVMGDGVHDGYQSARHQEPSEWAHAWTVTEAVFASGKDEDNVCYQAAREANPNGMRADYGFMCDLYPEFWQNVRQVFIGIQVAGPKLGPTSIDKGFHAIPKVLSTNPSVPACYYEPGDYTCVKDAAVQWWDTAGGATDGSAGCWRVPERGRRYTASHWPAGDITAQRKPDDPCNSNAGGQFVRAGTN